MYFQVIHNASVLNFISNSGLQLYRFAEFIYTNGSSDTKHIIETSKENVSKDLHTLIVFGKALWYMLCDPKFPTLFQKEKILYSITVFNF